MARGREPGREGRERERERPCVLPGLHWNLEISRSFLGSSLEVRGSCSKLVSKYVFRLPPQQPAVLNTCICSFSEPHFEYTEYVFDM